MSTIIKFNLQDLRILTNDPNSCVEENNVTQNIALQPWCLGNLKKSLENLLNCKIGKFDKEYNGILLSYKNLNILHNVGLIRNDNADINFQVQADYFIFKPHIGATLKGLVRKKCHTHLGVLVHRVFNVVIPRPKDYSSKDWEEIDEGVDVSFKITALDLKGTLPDISGDIIKIFKENKSNTDSYESHVNFDKTKPPKSSRKKSKTSLDKNGSPKIPTLDSNENNLSKKSGSDSDTVESEKKTKKRKNNDSDEHNVSKSKKHKKDL